MGTVSISDREFQELIDLRLEVQELKAALEKANQSKGDVFWVCSLVHAQLPPSELLAKPYLLMAPDKKTWFTSDNLSLVRQVRELCQRAYDLAKLGRLFPTDRC